MMKKLFLISTFALVCMLSQAQTVPSTIEFAGMKLKLSDDARKEIQTDVDALTRSEKFFKIKLDRVNMYMPIIERVMQEEGLPDDFKYLVIQESGLVSDAVSSSNAIGFWQFKVPAAEEVGMKIDNQVDERMNIVSSTRGAARYLKINYNQFGNWVYALMAYNTGRGGAVAFVNDKYLGAKQMPIDKNTHWYVKKFLAHKIAFQDVIGSTQGDYKLMEYTEGENKTLKEIANEFEIDLALIEEYNKWLRRGRIPEDKVYVVVLPFLITRPIPADILAQNPQAFAGSKQKTEEDINGVNNRRNTRIEKINEKPQLSKPMAVKINGLKGVIAPVNYDARSLAAFGGLTFEKFKSYNDLTGKDVIYAGDIYYLEKKKNKARVYYHTVSEGETLWSISQKYGLKMKKLMVKNRMRKVEQLEVGRILWLRHNRPSSVEIEYAKQPKSERPGANGSPTPKEIEQPVEVDTTSMPIAQKPVIESVKEETLEMVKDTSAIAKETVVVDSLQSKELPKAAVDSAKVVDTVQVPIQQTLEAETNEEDDITFENEEMDLDTIEEEPYKPIMVKEQEQSQKDLYHFVLPGETLYGLSRKYGVSLDEIKALNEDLLKEGLKSDQKLLIKKAAVKQKSKEVKTEKVTESKLKFKEYTVKQGDTMYSLAREFNVSLADLMKWNNKTEFELKDGEVLKILDDQ